MRPTSLRRDSNTGVFLWSLGIFLKKKFKKSTLKNIYKRPDNGKAAPTVNDYMNSYVNIGNIGKENLC